MHFRAKHIFLFLLLVLFLYSPQVHSVCVDTLDPTLVCDQGSPTNWEYYDSSSPSKLWDNVTCSGAGLHQCTCGETDAASPCAGCPRQSHRTAGNCFELDCSTPCTPAPQFSSQAKIGCLLVSLLIALAGAKTWKQYVA